MQRMPNSHAERSLRGRSAVRVRQSVSRVYVSPLLLLVATLPAFLEGQAHTDLKRFEKDNRWGFTEGPGIVVIPPQFSAAEAPASIIARIELNREEGRPEREGQRMDTAPIGVATMEEDGTIVLHLRAEGAGGIIGDSLLRYPPGHSRYAEVIRHLGGLKKGETKLVPPWPEKGDAPMEEKFLLTETPQDAVFLVSIGWTGGMGEAVLDPETWTIRFYEGLPVFVDSEVVRDLVKGKLPRKSSGNLGVRIAARVRLTKKKEKNPSIPGSPKQSFWQVRILELRDAAIVVQ